VKNPAIDLIPGHRIAVARGARVAKDKLQSQNAGTDTERDKLLDVAVNVVIDMMVESRALAKSIEVEEDATIQTIGRRLGKHTQVGRWGLEPKDG
jgi:hypothetical protein